MAPRVPWVFGADGIPQQLQPGDILSIVADDGCCFLSLSGSNLLLAPRDGNTVVVGTAVITIPDGGISLPPTGLTAGTTYYVYLNSAGALEASVTGYAVQSGTGRKVKSGDATRRLVGMVQPISGPAFSANLVRSYFHDTGISGGVALGSNFTTTATSSAPATFLTTTILLWANERVVVDSQAQVAVSMVNGVAYLQAAIDTNTTSPAANFQGYAANTNGTLIAKLTAQMTEGSHGLSLQGFSNTSLNTAIYYSGSTLTFTTTGSGA